MLVAAVLKSSSRYAALRIPVSERAHREPDLPHEHLDWEGWRESSRPENGTVESGALSKGEEALLVEFDGFCRRW